MKFTTVIKLNQFCWVLLFDFHHIKPPSLVCAVSLSATPCVYQSWCHCKHRFSRWLISPCGAKLLCKQMWSKLGPWPPDQQPSIWERADNKCTQTYPVLAAHGWCGWISAASSTIMSVFMWHLTNVHLPSWLQGHCQPGPKLLALQYLCDRTKWVTVALLPRWQILPWHTGVTWHLPP